MTADLEAWKAEIRSARTTREPVEEKPEPGSMKGMSWEDRYNRMPALPRGHRYPIQISTQAALVGRTQARTQALVRAEDFGDDIADKVRTLLKRNPNAGTTALMATIEGEDPDSEIMRRIFDLESITDTELKAERVADMNSAAANASRGKPPRSERTRVTNPFFNIGGGEEGSGLFENFSLTAGWEYFLPAGLSVLDSAARAIQGGIRGGLRAAEEGDWGQAAAQVYAGMSPGANAFLDVTDVLDDEAPSPWEQTELVQAGYEALGVDDVAGEGDLGEALRTPQNPLRVAGDIQSNIRNTDVTGFERFFNEQTFVDPQTQERTFSIAQQRARRAQRRASPTFAAGDDAYRDDIWTLGGGLVDSVNLDPNSMGARLLSGAADAAMLVFADPIGTVIGSGAKAAQAVRGAKVAAAALRLQDRFAAAGLPETDEALDAVRRIAARDGVDESVAFDTFVDDVARADEITALKDAANARADALRDFGPEQAARVFDDEIAEGQRIIDDATDAEARYGAQLSYVQREAEAARLEATTEVVEGPPSIGSTVRIGKGRKDWEVVNVLDDGSLAVRSEGGATRVVAADSVTVRSLAEDTPATAPGGGDISNADIAVGLRTLAGEADLPGVRVYTPDTIGAPRPFDNPDDVLVAMIDGESTLARFPRVGQTTQTPGFRAAEEFAGLQNADPQAKYVARIYDADDNALYLTRDDPNIDVALRSDKAKDVMEARRNLLGQRAWHYTDDGEWVEKTITEIQFGQRGTKLETAKLADEDIVQMQEAAPPTGAARILDGDATPTPQEWNSLLASLGKKAPDGVTPAQRLESLARTTAADTGALPTWARIVDEVNLYEQAGQMRSWMLRNDVLGVSKLGQTGQMTWLPDAFGATATRVAVSQVRPPRLPPAVMAASERAKQLELLVKQMRKARAAGKRRVIAARQRKADVERVGRILHDDLAKTRKAYDDKVDEIVAALRLGDDPEARRLIEEGGWEALSSKAREVILNRKPDGTWDAENLSLMEMMIRPNRGIIARTYGPVLDRMFRRINTNLPEVLARTSNPQTINRLFNGKISEEEVVRALADATTADEVRTIMASTAVKYQDAYRSGARHSEGFLTKASSDLNLGQRVLDRMTRLGEQVSERNPYLDFTNPTQSSMVLHRWLRSAGASTRQADDTIKAYWDAEPHARARVVWDTVIKTYKDSVVEGFAGRGTDGPRYDKLKPRMLNEVNEAFKTHSKTWEDIQGDFVSRFKDSNGFPEYTLTDGPDRVMKMSDVHSEAAILDTGMRLPDVQRVRNTATRIGRAMIYTNAIGIKEAVVGLNNLWRTSLLLRPAYILRNIMEASARLLFHGRVGLLTHPVHALAVALGGMTRWRKLYKALEGSDVLYKTGTGGDLRNMSTGELDISDFDRQGNLLSPGMREYSETNLAAASPRDVRMADQAVRSEDWMRVEVGDPRYWEGHARELMRMRDDRILVALAGNYEEFPELGRMMRRAERDGGLQTEDVWRAWLSTDEGKAAIKRRFDVQKSSANNAADWSDPDFWMEYLFDSPASKTNELALFTQGNEALLDYVRRGVIEVDGERLWSDARLFDLRRRKGMDLGRDVGSVPKGTFNESSVLSDVSAAVRATGMRDRIAATGMPMVVSKPSTATQSAKATLDRVIDAWFTYAGRAERDVSWNIEWRYNYYTKSMQALDALSPEDAMKWLEEIKDTIPLNLRAGLNRIDPKRPFASARRRLPDTPVYDDMVRKTKARLANPKGEEGRAYLTPDELDMVAGQYASDLNKEMFYGFHSMNNLWQALRFAIPFGAPTVNSYKAFGRSLFDVTNLVTRHKNFARMLNTLTTPESGVINEFVAQFEPSDYDTMIEADERLANRPFLFRTEDDGPLQFRWPLVGSYLGATLNALGFLDENADYAANSEMTSYLGSLNLALQGVREIPQSAEGLERGFMRLAQLLPGVGFTVQMGAQPLVETADNPFANFTREWAFPYGMDNQREFGISWMPAWFRRSVLGGMFPGGVGEREARTQQKAALGWLATRNVDGVDWSTPEGQLLLEQRSENMAAGLTFLRGITSGILPAGTTWQLPAIDAAGSDAGLPYLQYLVAEEYYQIFENAPDQDAATLNFLDKYGDDFAMLIQGSTRLVGGGGDGAPLTEDAVDALIADNSLAAYRQSLPILFPGDTTRVAYQWERQLGLREQMSQKERIEEAAAQKYEWKMAVLQQRADREKMSDEEFDLRKDEIEAEIWSNNPPSTTIPGGGGDQIDALRNAVQHPGLRNAPGAEPARQALEAYDYWLSVARKNEDSDTLTLKAKSAMDQRMAFLTDLDAITAEFGLDGDEVRRTFARYVQPSDERTM